MNTRTDIGTGLQANPNIDTIRGYYAASARGDLVAMMACLTPTTRWIEMAGFPCAGTWIGPDAVVKNVFEVLAAQWDAFRFELDRLMGGGADVIATGTYHATSRETGKPMQARVAHVFQLEGGKIVQFEQFVDTLWVERARRQATESA